MSRFVYTPDGAEPRKWTFEVEHLDCETAELIEEVYGKTYAYWAMDALQGGMKARRVLLWVLLRKDAPELEYDAVKPHFDDVSFELDDAESDELKADLEARDAAGESLTEQEQVALRELRDGAVVPKDGSVPEAVAVSV